MMRFCSQSSFQFRGHEPIMGVWEDCVSQVGCVKRTISSTQSMICLVLRPASSEVLTPVVAFMAARRNRAFHTHYLTVFAAACRASFITLSSDTARPPWRLLSSAACIKANISKVSSALTGGLPVLKNFTASITRGL